MPPGRSADPGIRDAALGRRIVHQSSPGETPTFRTDFYFSGTTFFTLGLGDVTPRPGLARLITVTEAGTGFGFLGLVISYLPTLYGAFSQRELNISLLDARAGSPPTAAELLRRHAQFRDAKCSVSILHDWEIWSAQLMESHLSYPVLCYFRSQHDNQSWLAAFAAVLDVCALLDRVRRRHGQVAVAFDVRDFAPRGRRTWRR